MIHTDRVQAIAIAIALRSAFAKAPQKRRKPQQPALAILSSHTAGFDAVQVPLSYAASQHWYQSAF